MDSILNFNWKYVASILGSSHSSIIGFISCEWIKQNPSDFFVLDGAPSPITGKGRLGQKNSDLILMEIKDGKTMPKIVVEVETTQWEKKLETLSEYCQSSNYKGSKGLLVITKVKGKKEIGETYYADKEEEKQLSEIKEKIKTENASIAVIEIFRVKNHVNILNDMNVQSSYYRWEVDCIRYWDKDKSVELFSR